MCDLTDILRTFHARAILFKRHCLEQVFTLDWTADWISIAINGKPVAVYTNATLVQTLTDVQPLILTATVMERLPTLPADRFPQEYWVDYVRIYQWDEDDA